MEARYKYRLRVSCSKAALLDQTFNSCRFVWNQALGRWGDLWRHEDVSLDYNAMAAELTDWRSRFDWLSEQPVTPQQQILRDLRKSISAFFDKKNPAGRPTFKRKGSLRSAEWNANGFALRNDRLEIATSAGRISLQVVWSRPLPSAPRSVRVFQDGAGRWWASFVVRVEAEAAGTTSQSTGLDVGLTTYATTEFADADIENPRFARRAAKALARSQRNMVRKQRGSSNRARAKVHTARIHARVASQRKDWTHKQARILTRRFDHIGVEDLGFKNLQRKGGRRKKGLNRSIADAGWGEFLRALEWHAKKCGHEVVRINPRGTSQTCSSCGAKAKQPLTLADRTLACGECGLVLDRDRNAARNLNPNRLGCTGAPVDGSKSLVPAGTRAA